MVKTDPRSELHSEMQISPHDDTGPIGFSVRRSLIPKRGTEPGQCEDQLAIAGDGQSPLLLAAVADGATEAIFSRKWADHLTRLFIRTKRSRQVWDTAWVETEGRKFRGGFDITTLPWFAQEKAGRGSFASLLGLRLDFRSRTYSAQSVGDCCLAVVADDSLDIFPAEFADPDAFGSNPYLISSNPSMNNELDQQARVLPARRLRSDTAVEFFLMTDALAAWFSREASLDRQPWRSVAEHSDLDTFAEFVERCRESGEMRNDDVALIHIRVDRSTV